MLYRQLGNTDLNVSGVSFGTWAIGGGSWGFVDRAEGMQGLYKAMDEGVNLFDTADIYGRSEEMVGEATRGREDEIYIATKFGRGEDPNDPATYTEEAVRRFCEASLQRIGRETIDLYQIHCPPLHIIEQGDVFEVLDKLQQEGKIRHYGVSVESVEEGLAALQYPGVRALQVIFNIFRQKPLEELFPQAHGQGVGILARLPLASGLLTGKFTVDSTFPEEDHRNYNRDGQQFNVGETFAGLPFELGVRLADELDWIAEGRESMVAAALRWILSFESVTCAIPGFKNVRQVEQNVQAARVPPFSDDELERLATFYREQVHANIRGIY